MYRCQSILVAALGLVLVVPAAAQTTFVAALSGSNEVPAVATPATGYATVVLDAAQTQLSISCQVQNLLGVWHSGLVHGPAAVGFNGPVRFAIYGWVFSNGGHDATTSDFIVGGITPTDVNNLNAGLYYVNVHSSQFPGGELRGQLTALPVSTTKSTWSRIKSLFR